MALIIFDIVTGTLQSLLIAYMAIYCADGNKINKVNIIKFLSITIMFIIISSNFFTGVFGNNGGLSVFLTHIMGIFVITLFYRKDIISGITSYIYSMIASYAIIFGNLIFEFIKGIISKDYINYEIIFIIHIPQWIMMFLCVRYAEKIREIYKFIIREKFVITGIIMSFSLDFIATFYLLTLGKASQILRNIIEILFLIFFIIILIYFSKVNRKSKEIYELNKSLEIKNKELRKIKHDYGAQISYLYGLCLMDRFDDLKQALKNIINANDNIPSAVEINESNNSLLSFALKPALEQGIHVIIKSDCNIGLCIMPEMELYRILSNIVNNAIKAMNGEGIIIAKAYEQVDHIVIKIENNGPKIDEKFIDKIFEVGFTTKTDDEKNHGFGLSIVKELIESYNGKISLRSNDISTEFKIILPINIV